MIWGGAATAAYGVYLWGPTVVSLLFKVPVPQAAKYFVCVTGAGIVGKIIVSMLAPLIGRRLLGVMWGFGGVVALSAVGYSGSAFIGSVPLIVVFLAAVGVLHRRQLFEPRALHGRELWRAARRPRLGARTDG